MFVKLYKCIPFTSEYWQYIANEKQIRFATIPELISGNDKLEFDHRWDSSSPAFQRLSAECKERYNGVYNKVVTACFGQSPNKECWDHYCGNGGVRYEFEFDPTFESGVSRSPVTYDDLKTFNLHSFLLRQDLDPRVRSLFESTSSLDLSAGMLLHDWLNSGEAYKIIVDHSTKEIPFKKLRKYRFEDEFRFIHLTEPIQPKELKPQLVDQKVPLFNLGLKLVRIATSSVDTVKEKVPNSDIEIVDIYFD